MTEPTYRTEIKWLAGIGLRADGTLDRYGIRNGELTLIMSHPPEPHMDLKAIKPSDLVGIKNKHLMDLKTDLDNCIFEVNVGASSMTGNRTSDDEAIAAFEAGIDVVDSEFERRGMNPDDGFTIVDEAKYDAWSNNP